MTTSRGLADRACGALWRGLVNRLAALPTGRLICPRSTPSIKDGFREGATAWGVGQLSFSPSSTSRQLNYSSQAVESRKRTGFRA